MKALTTLLYYLHCFQLLFSTTTLGKLQLLSCSLLVLPYFKWSYYIKFHFHQSSAQAINYCKKSSLINSTLYDAFFPQSPSELTKELKEMLWFTIPGNQELMAFLNINQMFNNFVFLSIYVNDIKQIMGWENSLIWKHETIILTISIAVNLHYWIQTEFTRPNFFLKDKSEFKICNQFKISNSMSKTIALIRIITDMPKYKTGNSLLLSLKSLYSAHYS